MTQERDHAKKIIGLLEQGTQRLDAPTLDRLASARKQAIAAMNTQVHADEAELVHAATGHFTTPLPGRPAWVAGLLVLAVALLALVLSHRPPVEADALLLASELPPEAYIDKGFDAWLKNSSQP